VNSNFEKTIELRLSALKAKLVLSAVALLLLSACVTNSAVAQEPSVTLPTNAKQTLAKILLEDDFQPRSSTLGPWQQIWAKISPFFEHYLGRLWDMLSEFLSDSMASAPTWLFNFSNATTTFLSIAACLCLLYTFAIIVRKIAIPLLKKATRRISTSPQVNETDTLAAFEYLEKGQYAKALEKLRITLRSKLANEYHISDATTDRELSAAVAETTESKNQKAEEELFTEVSKTFENTAYAEQPMNSSYLKEMLEKFGRFGSYSK